MKERDAIQNGRLGGRLDRGVALRGKDGRKKQGDVGLFVGDEDSRRPRGENLVEHAGQFGEDPIHFDLEAWAKAPKSLGSTSSRPGLHVSTKRGQPVGADLRRAPTQGLRGLVRSRLVARLGRPNELFHSRRRVPTEEVHDGPREIHAAALSGVPEFRKHLRLKGWFARHVARSTSRVVPMTHAVGASR